MIVRNRHEPLGKVLAQLSFDSTSSGDHIISDDTVLLRTEQPRLTTGADVLGRLLRGIVKRSRRVPDG